MRRRILALGAVAAVAGVTTACSSASGRSLPPLSQVPAVTATTAPPGPNPDVVPSIITPAYVDAVFKVLNHVYGDATRALVLQRSVTPEVQMDLRAIFAQPLLGEQLRQAQESLSGPLNNVRQYPGDGVTTVVRIIAASANCIFVSTKTNLDAVLVKPTPPAASEYYRLTAKASGSGPDSLNPTPWLMSFNAAFLQPTSVSNQCP